MLFFNKLSVSPDGPPHEHVMGPGPVSCIQLGFAIAFCGFLYASGIESFENITNLHTLKMYTVYCVLFVGKYPLALIILTRFVFLLCLNTHTDPSRPPGLMRQGACTRR